MARKTKASKNTKAVLTSAPNGTMRVMCWCKANIVHVPVELVGRTTESCGKESCHP